MGKSTISIVIFNSYVKLPEGKKSPSTWKYEVNVNVIEWTSWKHNVRHGFLGLQVASCIVPAPSGEMVGQ